MKTYEFIHITERELKEAERKRKREEKRIKLNEETLLAIKQASNPTTVSELSKLLNLTMQATLNRIKEVEKENKVKLKMQCKGVHGRFYYIYVRK